MSDRQDDEENRPRLEQKLGAYMISSIGLTVVIGSGVFIDYGSAIKTAGPGGMLVAFSIVSTLAISAMDGLSEMIQLFPTVNPIVELVHEFVDPELARLTGFAHWFAYSSFMVVQLSRAATYLDFYVNPTAGWEFAKVVTFYILLPLIIVLLNVAPVKVFGYVESLSGVLKLLILAIVISMCVYIAGESKVAAPFHHPFRSRLTESNLASGSALCLSIEFIAFSFCGIEAIALTTFEAKDASSLRLSSRFLAVGVSVIYLLSAISQILLLNWEPDNDIDSAKCVPTFDQLSHDISCHTASVITIAAGINASHGMARAMNGMFIFCAFSAANSCLYVSSRMLYGIAYSSSQNQSAWQKTRKFWKFIAHVTPSGVPLYAVLISSAVFIWVPFTQIKDLDGTDRLIPWFTNAGSLCVIFVWGTVNLAYVRYFFWFKGFSSPEGELSRSSFLRLNRWNRDKGCSTLLSWAQPVVAMYAVAGSYIIVFILASADLWRPFSIIRTKVFFQYFTIPILLPVVWILMKSYVLVKLAVKNKKTKDSFADMMKRGWRKLSWYKQFGNDVGTLKESITNLTLYLKPDQRRHIQRLQDGPELEPLNQASPDI